MFVCVRERGGKQRAHIAVCFNVGAGAGRATYLNMARLLTLHITVPPLQRPTMGYYHLASVNTSYAAELWTSEVGSWLLDAWAASASEGKNLSCLRGQFYWFTESFSNMSRDSCDLSVAVLFVLSPALCLRSQDARTHTNTHEWPSFSSLHAVFSPWVFHAPTFEHVKWIPSLIYGPKR